jgi:hypothetical protein
MVVADAQTLFAIFVANRIDLWWRLRRAVFPNPEPGLPCEALAKRGTRN